MRRGVLAAVCGCVVVLGQAGVLEAQVPARPRRADSAFGLHFDLHANLGIQNAGETLTEEMLGELLTRVKPDFIQVDCKGHPGVSSYPTRVPEATHVPGFAKDPLELIRRTTARHGVALYLHYSGVWDSQAVKKHPEWAAHDGPGKPSEKNASVFSAYVEQVMIPQLVELATRYGCDGVWVDGECWAIRPDYSPAAVAAYRAATGAAEAPEPQAEGYAGLLEFTRRSFLDHVKRYVEAAHAQAPGFQVASNWAYSSMMPEPVEVGVDFLSGDFNPRDSVRVGEFEARCLEPQARGAGKPWDLMDWSFAKDWADTGRPSDPKTAVQMMQSAASVVALGGGYQAYFKQNSDLSMRPADFPVMERLARFVRERQGVCFQAVPMKQVAVLYSTAGWKADTKAVYGHANTEALRGLTEALLDNQLGVEILMTHTLRGRVAEYPLVAVPDWAVLEEDLKSELVAHVQAGGKLLLCGPRVTRLMAPALGLEISGLEDAPGMHYLGREGAYAGIKASVAAMAEAPGDQVLAMLYRRPEPATAAGPAAVVRKVGQGQVGFLLPDLGNVYRATTSPVVRDTVGATARVLFPEPQVEVTGSRLVHVVPAMKEGRLVVNLTNVAGPHADRNQPVYDEIPALGPLNVRIRRDGAPRRVTLEPGGSELAAKFEAGVLSVEVPRLEIHAAVVVE